MMQGLPRSIWTMDEASEKVSGIRLGGEKSEHRKKYLGDMSRMYISIRQFGAQDGNTLGYLESFGRCTLVWRATRASTDGRKRSIHRPILQVLLTDFLFGIMRKMQETYITVDLDRMDGRMDDDDHHLHYRPMLG